MSAIGPELPPHLLAKRKRQAEEKESPAQQVGESSARKPPDSNSDSERSAESASNKRTRVLGPAPPPAPLSQRPRTPPDSHKQQRNDGSSSDSDEDDFGPSLPDPTGASPSTTDQHSRFPDHDSEPGNHPAKRQRDEWMVIPPKQDDLAARMDPTKLRARGFNTAKGAKGAPQRGGADNAIWTETPDQKRKRLEDEMLGVREPDSAGPGREAGDSAKSASARKRAEDEHTASKVRKYNEEHRRRTLMDQHQDASADTERKKKEEDDPSKRGFDYDKDMGGGGGKIGYRARREMLDKARGFTGKFSGGGYL